MNIARIVLWSVVAAVVLGGADVVLTSTARHDNVLALRHAAPTETSYMQSALTDGHPVREHRWIALDDVAPAAACAVVMAEDEQFFRNGALSWPAQRAVLLRMLQGDFSRGGSGIAQQLARNLFLNANRTPRRKLHEYLLAVDLLRSLPKWRILELYLNVSEWGDGVWGIEAASQHYFGVSAAALTPSQAVVLASMLPAPRRELETATSGLAHRRQLAIAKKLCNSRLLNDQDLGETRDRLREWRKWTRGGASARDGWVQAEMLMGPEARMSFVSNPAGVESMDEWCNVRRRGL